MIVIKIWHACHNSAFISFRHSNRCTVVTIKDAKVDCDAHGRSRRSPGAEDKGGRWRLHDGDVKAMITS